MISRGNKYCLVFLIVILGISASCSEEKMSIPLNGTWHVAENSQLFGTRHYDAHITQIDSTQLEITNFYNLGTDIYVNASLDQLDIRIDKQNIGGYIIQGTGKVKSDYKSITFNYTVNDGTVEDPVIAQFKR